MRSYYMREYHTCIYEMQDTVLLYPFVVFYDNYKNIRILTSTTKEGCFIIEFDSSQK